MYQVKFFEVFNVDGVEKQTPQAILVPGIEPALALANVLVRISTCDPSGQLVYREIQVLRFENNEEK